MQQKLFARWLQINYKYHSRTMFYDFFLLFTPILIYMRLASHFQTPIDKEELRFSFI